MQQIVAIKVKIHNAFMNNIIRPKLQQNQFDLNTLCKCFKGCFAT